LKLWVVSEVLGYAALPITKDVYGHLVGDEKEEATEAITDVLFERDGSEYQLGEEGSGRRSSPAEGVLGRSLGVVSRPVRMGFDLREFRGGSKDEFILEAGDVPRLLMNVMLS
jgi:hypothetical protein